MDFEEEELRGAVPFHHTVAEVRPVNMTGHCAVDFDHLAELAHIRFLTVE